MMRHDGIVRPISSYPRRGRGEYGEYYRKGVEGRITETNETDTLPERFGQSFVHHPIAFSNLSFLSFFPQVTIQAIYQGVKPRATFHRLPANFSRKKSDFTVVSSYWRFR
jgi:hypothetical protein